MTRTKVWLLGMVLALGCGWLPFLRERPKIERKVTVPFGAPGRVELVTLRGAWLRAAEIASESYFSELEPPSDPTSLEACLARRESYDVDVWAQEEAGDGGENGGEIDGGAGSVDAGESDAGSRFDAPVPRILFVSIYLHWDACDLGESPPTDMGGQYAIDTSTWHIVGWRP